MSQSNDSGLNLDHLEALMEYCGVTVCDGSYGIVIKAMNGNSIYLTNDLLLELARRAALANQPAHAGMSIALAEVTEKLGRMSAENLSLGVENRQLREQLAAANQPVPTVPASIDHDAFWIRVAACRDAKPGAAYRVESEALVCYVDHWAAHQPAQEQAVPRPELTVWVGQMPESNGKTNYTAMLKRKDAGPFDTNYMTIARSEYPDRVSYEADCVRFLIGESSVDPCSLDYDSEKHSGYVKPAQAAQQEPVAAPQIMYSAPITVSSMTLRKREFLEKKGYSVVGYVMQDAKNERCTVAHGNVMWDTVLGKD